MGTDDSTGAAVSVEAGACVDRGLSVVRTGEFVGTGEEQETSRIQIAENRMRVVKGERMQGILTHSKEQLNLLCLEMFTSY
jgi:hypothetical protein